MRHQREGRNFKESDGDLKEKNSEISLSRRSLKTWPSHGHAFSWTTMRGKIAKKVCETHLTVCYFASLSMIVYSSLSLILGIYLYHKSHHFSIKAGRTSDQKSKVANCITVMVDLHTDPAYLKDEDHRKVPMRMGNKFQMVSNEHRKETTQQEYWSWAKNNKCHLTQFNVQVSDYLLKVHMCVYSMKGKLESCEAGWFGVFGSRVCWTERVRLRDKKRESQSSSTGWFTYNKTTQIEGENRNSCYMDAEGVLFFSETNPKIYVNPVVHNRKIDQVQLVFARCLPTV